jgi:hypothetical protein
LIWMVRGFAFSASGSSKVSTPSVKSAAILS